MFDRLRKRFFGQAQTRQDMLEDILQCLYLKCSDRQFVLLGMYQYREAYAHLGDGIAICITTSACSHLMRLGAYLNSLPDVESLELNPSRFMEIAPFSLSACISSDVFTVAGRGEKFFEDLKAAVAVPWLEKYFPRLRISHNGEIEITLEGSDSRFQCGCAIPAHELEALIQGAESIPEREIIVQDPIGDVRINEFGFRLGQLPKGWAENAPFWFDLEDYARFFERPVPDNVRLEDIGYLTYACRYVRPAFDAGGQV